MRPVARPLALAALAFAGCETRGAERAAAVAVDHAAIVRAAAAANPAARVISIDDGETGIRPAQISAKPGEALSRVCPRTVATECGRAVKVPGQAKPVDLPVGKPVAVAIKAPASGEVVFTCWMDMMRGVVRTTP